MEKAIVREHRCLTGFTLVELLLAASIFSVIVLSIYSAFQTGILSYRKADAAFGLLQEARLILYRMELDLKNSFAYTKENSRFQGTQGNMDFFSLTDTFSEGQVFSNLSRIKYELASGILKRVYYKGKSILEETGNGEDQELSSDVKGISFQYAYATNNPAEPYGWQSFWPKKENESDLTQQKAIPLAVKIELTMKEQGGKGGSAGGQQEQEAVFTRIISLPGSAL